VKIWGDAYFAWCSDTRRSVSGWVVVCFVDAVSWESFKQRTTAVSTMDAGYRACESVARDALLLRKLLREFSVLCREMWPREASLVLCDNTAAVSLCSDRKETKIAKHIDIVHHFAQDRFASVELKFVNCKSKDNVSDCLTKALPRPLLEVGRRGLGMCDECDH
jgi:hypothetical protein